LRITTTRGATLKQKRYNLTIRLTIRLILLLSLLAFAAGCGDATPTVRPSEQPVASTVTPTQQSAAATATLGQSIAATSTPGAAVSEATNAGPATTGTPGADGRGTAGVPSGKTYTNPVIHSNFPDPFVLQDNGTYYAYATNGAGKNIQAARSADLVSWELLSDAMPALPSWAKLGGSLVWAPEVIKAGDKYVMYYVARDKASNKQCVGVAISDKPEGKFKDTNDKAFVCQADQGGTIDPDVFRDGDKLYLYFKNDGNCCAMPTKLWAQELAPDGLSLVGEPSQLVQNDVPWEGKVVEAPTMWKHDNNYYLFFSGNNYAGFEYAVGYATCNSPTGPCQQAAENPILASRMQQKPLIVGPGHQTLVQVGDQTWIVYHVWEVLSSGMTSSNRYVYIDRLDWKDGKPVVEGPSTDAEPAP
jgi:beta-xylosidase